MKNKIYIFILLGLFSLTVYGSSNPTKLPNDLIEKIESEISIGFEKSIKAGNELDVTAISENVNDNLKTGFIDNGVYFNTFEELMVGFKSGIIGLENQKMNIETKKITVLSKNNALLTCKGNFSAKTINGRVLTGKFAWTFVYSLINNEWKVIHSHMSNPK